MVEKRYEKPCNFIRTEFEETANQLRKAGFNELQKEGKYFVFLNNGVYGFQKSDGIDVDKVAFTNMLCV